MENESNDGNDLMMPAMEMCAVYEDAERMDRVNAVVVVVVAVVADDEFVVDMGADYERVAAAAVAVAVAVGDDNEARVERVAAVEVPGSEMSRCEDVRRKVAMIAHCCCCCCGDDVGS